MLAHKEVGSKNCRYGLTMNIESKDRSFACRVNIVFWIVERSVLFSVAPLLDELFESRLKVAAVSASLNSPEEAFSIP